MSRDPIIDEVRAIRDAIAREHNYDIDAIFDTYRAQERASGRVYVTFPSKPWPEPTPAAGEKNPDPTNPPITDLEIAETMRLLGGSFFCAIGDAAIHADPMNLAKLKHAFAEDWARYRTLAQTFRSRPRPKMPAR
jgi:hypothetical protein